MPVMAAVSRVAHAAKPRIYTARFSDLALGGYDSVSYFKQSAPVKGSKSLALEHEGAKWLFESTENRETFAADPEKYMPQFGGYCAFSVAKNKLVKGDPRLWHIENDKLYINYNKGVHQIWLKRKVSMIASASKHWPEILG